MDDERIAERADKAIAAADRAANAAGRCQVKGGGWVAEVGATGGSALAAAHVRAHPDAPAEALYLSIRQADVAWADLGARKRVAVEVFRATLLICDRLYAAPLVGRTTPEPRGLERIGKRAPTINQRERLR